MEIILAAVQSLNVLVCPDKLSDMMQKIDKVMKDHDNFESVMSRWESQYLSPD